MCTTIPETREEVKQRLEESMNLPVATIDDLPYIPTGVSTEKLTEYLESFTKPSRTCWFCKDDLYVQWGIQHGMAHCNNCGFDVKMFHYFEDDKGEKVRLERSLQFHPKNYSVDEKE
ncbi:hypothetical protein COF68_05090 [Bacillus toyonensis]|uniref:hypothetical protein n=1 Tax=Bacillus toyonensis TaxID=155322 RepID=UPI000BFB1EF4|nr:hypothetical protein [Bacillus toyonensis]PHE64222.1 hypothetical protein COF68_05090 [Bacillus toyonensis]